MRLESADPGFDTRGALAARLYLGGTRYATAASQVAAMRATLDRAGALPGAARVAVVTAAPMAGWSQASGLTIEGRETRPDEGLSAEWRGMSSGALATLGVPLVTGRDVTPAEAADSLARAVVINETMAKRFWPGASALGRRVSVSGGERPVWLTVVGVARDVAMRGAGERPRNQLWRPWATASGRTMTVLVRARAAAAREVAAMAPSLRRAIAAADPTIPVVQVATLADVVHESLWRFALYGWLFGTFAAAALLLAVVGVYGVIAYQVAQRTRELGVRVALGARPADVYKLVVGDGARLAAYGMGVGLVLAFGLTRVLRAVLHGVSATDPLVFGVVTASLLGAALLASWVPARRAARVEPTVALRSE